MKYMQLLFSFLSVLFCTISNAQESSVKLYTNFHLFKSNPMPTGLGDYYDELTSNQLSLAFRKISQRDWVHELEGAYLSTDLGFAKSKGYNIRYSLGRYLWKSKNERIRLLLSGASRVFYNRLSLVSERENLNTIRRDIGLNLSLFTHLEIDLSKKFYLDINGSFLGVTISDNSWKQGPLQGPLNTYNGSSILTGMNDRLLRVGVGFRF